MAKILLIFAGARDSVCMVSRIPRERTQATGARWCLFAGLDLISSYDLPD